MAATVDFITEIHIAQYWRKQLGEIEYVYYNPDDLRRWYIALETRGPDEIRDYIIERTGRFPMSELRGLVSVAPHPPIAIVNIWLRSHDKVRTGSYWAAFAGLFLFSVFAGPYMQGCMQLKSIDHLAQHPVPMSIPMQPGLNSTAPASTATFPGLAPAPALPSSNPAQQSSSTSTSAAGHTQQQ